MNNIKIQDTTFIEFLKGAAIDIVFAALLLSIAYATGMMRKFNLFQKRKRNRK